MRKSLSLALTILIASMALTACGQKGALYLPADPDAQTAGADAAAMEEKAKKEKPQASD
jgi:predicted small lipoprotein YifL